MGYREPTTTREKGRHVLIYDDDCGVCFATSQLIQKRSRARLELMGFSELPGSGLLEDLTRQEVLASAHYVTPDGIEFHGGQAMTRVMRLVPGGILFRILDLPGTSLLRDVAYRVFAANRLLISRLTRQEACVIRPPVDEATTSQDQPVESRQDR